MEWRLFPEDTIPEWTTPGWYAGREAAPHLEQEGHRQRLIATARMVDQAVLLGADSVTDLGAGDGGLLSIISAPHKLGYDLQQSNVDAARIRGVDVTLADVVAKELIPSADCVVATEFLEHLVDPHELLARLAAKSPARWLVASSPYTETGDAHYGYHTWAWDEAGYRRLLEDNGWQVVSTELAWISQVVLCRKS